MKLPFEDKIATSMVQKYAGGVIRSGLLLIAGHYFAKGTVDQDQIAELSSAIVAVGTVVWSIFQKYRAQTVLVTALASSTPMSEDTAKAMVASPLISTPPANTPTTVVPSPSVPVLEAR